MNSENLENAIYKTIVYFDIFSYPLTEIEVHKWLWKKKADIKEVILALEKLSKAKKITYKDGLYFLPGRERYISERRLKYIQAEKKYTKVKRISKILQIIPFIRFIGVCNTLPILDFNEESDIDIFIIVKKNRMWTTRFLTTALTAIVGQWRHGTRVHDKLCLSFYVTTDNLNLESIAIKPKDPYLVYWVNFLTTILDRDVYSHFWEQNQWIKEFTPNTRPQEMLEKRRKIKESTLVNTVRKIAEKILWKRLGSAVEKKLRNWQLSKIKKREQERETPSHILFKDSILKFHEIDRREKYREEWTKKILDTTTSNS